MCQFLLTCETIDNLCLVYLSFCTKNIFKVCKSMLTDSYKFHAEI